MKTIKKTVWFLGLLLLFTSLQAQDNDAPYSVNEATLAGFGSYKIKNTYLSAIKYDGWGINIVNERMKLVRPHLSRQQMLHLNISTVSHPAGTARSYSGFVDYSYGLHYRFRPASGLKVLVGGSADALFGFVYNMQNSNNPAALHFDAGINLSTIAIYSLSLKNYPLTLRYQADMAMMGMLFSPHYGQSYYEIFIVGNAEDIVKFSSLHNKFALRNYLTIDFPVGCLTIRLGYMNDIYRTHVNGIKAHYVSNGFMVGVVKEFISFGGKRLQKKPLYKSAYY